ncbi:hypothetical protein I7I53_11614 [Histoplasma capsulatum var. duboisii H88]|uniref:Uncharacterized protein n=1 Tax=Ajellomyces capsulatus (strain H88) TaxID=544711 RepID=A0A8A1LY04_AJEC8|nr:hypothetical protein I7I53_11614 [Histoplasma capsulatum var. duboisii H88]
MTSFRIGPLASTPTPQQQQLLKEQRPPGHQLLAHIAKPWLFKYIYKQLPFSNCSDILWPAAMWLPLIEW